MISYNPAKIFDFDKKGSLKIGNKADLVIFDPNFDLQIDRKFFFSKSLNSPFLNQKFKGKILKVFKDGEMIFNDGNFFRV